MQQSLKISPIKKKQVKQTVKILSAAFNMSAAQVKKGFMESYSGTMPPVTFVSTVNDQVTGVIRILGYSDKNDDEQFYCLFQLAVDPAFRHRGIGHALMRHAENYIRKNLRPGQPCTIIITDETKRENPASLFYEKMGYAPESPPRMAEDNLPILEKHLCRKNFRPKN